MESNGKIGDITLNEAEKKLFQVLNQELTDNLLQRSTLIERIGDPRRDIEQECGWEDINTITASMYRRFYEENAFAERVVELYPVECWQITPEVFETEDTENVTAFEQSWKDLNKSLNESSKYKGEEGSQIWRYLQRADKLAGIGHYGIILLGLNDGRDLAMPAPGFEKEDELDLFEEADLPEQMRLTYIRVFDESQAQITRWEQDPSSPRYGFPTHYKVSFHDIDDNTGYIGMPISDKEVHWSRVIHIAKNLDHSEIIGVPEMRSVLPHLLDLKKIYGATGEGVWRGAFPGLAVETNPALGTDVEINKEEVREELQNYANRLQRVINLVGMSVRTLSPTIVDTTPHIEMEITAICIKLGCPKRVFMGSEIGELASTQDTGRWESRLRGRRESFITPGIIVPFIDRLIQLTILEEPEEGFSVSWKQREMLSPMEKAQIASTLVAAITEYINGGGETLMSPKDFLVYVLRFSLEEAESILENVSDYVDQLDGDFDFGTDKLIDFAKGSSSPPETEPEPQFPLENTRGRTDSEGGHSSPGVGYHYHDEQGRPVDEDGNPIEGSKKKKRKKKKKKKKTSRDNYNWLDSRITDIDQAIQNGNIDLNTDEGYQKANELYTKLVTDVGNSDIPREEAMMLLSRLEASVDDYGIASVELYESFEQTAISLRNRKKKKKRKKNKSFSIDEFEEEVSMMFDDIDISTSEDAEIAEQYLRQRRNDIEQDDTLDDDDRNSMLSYFDEELERFGFDPGDFSSTEPTLRKRKRRAKKKGKKKRKKSRSLVEMEAEEARTRAEALDKLNASVPPPPNVKNTQVDEWNSIKWEIGERFNNSNVATLVSNFEVIDSTTGESRKFTASFNLGDTFLSLGDSFNTHELANLEFIFVDDANKTSKTGRGEAKQIFRKVSQRFAHGVVSLQPDQVSFSGEGTGRVGLYRYLTERAAKTIPGYAGLAPKKPKTKEVRHGYFFLVKEELLEEALEDLNLNEWEVYR
jgi:hypothetical protein